MDLFRCDICNKIENEFDFNFASAQKTGAVLCRQCIAKLDNGEISSKFVEEKRIEGQFRRNWGHFDEKGESNE